MREAEIGVLQKEKMHFSPRQSTFSHAECQGNKGLAGLRGILSAGLVFTLIFGTLHSVLWWKNQTLMTPLVGAQRMGRNESCAKFNLSLWQSQPDPPEIIEFTNGIPL